MQDLKKTELFKKFERFGLIDSDMWKYLGRLDELLPVIQKFLEYVPITYPHHTSHNIQHSLTVVHRIGQLLEDELVKEMTNVEFFIIVASALLHDTGMVVSQEELERFENDPESQGTTSEYFRKNHASRSAKFVHDIQKLLDPSGPRNSRMIRYIAKICEAHGLPMERLEDDEEFPRRVEIDLQEVNVKFLAACLRLGDLLDMDYQRACPIIILSLIHI